MPENTDSSKKYRKRIVSSDAGREKRVPPGQSETKKWPVLHYGKVPKVDLKTWQFRVFGGGVKEWRCGWEAFRGLPWVDVACDIHCVTRWSRLNNVFSGPGTRTVLEAARGGGDAGEGEVCAGALRAGIHDEPAAGGISGRRLFVWNRARWRRPHAGSWVAGATGGAAAVFLEECEMGAGH